MKAKVGRGNGFRGVLDYALGKNKGAEIVGGTISSGTPRQLAQEFGLVRRLRPDAKNPVWHCSLSLPKGENLNSDKWDALSSDFMEEMGFSESTPWVAIRHADTDHDHIHIVASRISLDGALWHGKWEARTAIEATQKLEEIHGLTLTPGLNGVDENWQKTSRVRGRKTLKKGEVEMGLRTGEQPPKLKLQNAIDEALSVGDLTAVQLAETLSIAGVQVRANLASTGRFNGFSYELDGVAFKGSSLGKAYSWGGLQKRGVSYEQDRDREQLTQFTAARASESDQRVINESRSDRTDTRDIRPDNTGATPEHTGAGRPDHSGGDQIITTTVADVERENGHIGEDTIKGGEGGGILGESSEADTAGGLEGAQRGGSDPAATMETTINSGSGSGSAGKRPGGGWNARFKAASAKARDKRHAATEVAGASNNGGNRIAIGDLQATKQINPIGFIERMGYSVKKDGQRHFRIRHGKDEAYRLTQKHDGCWVWVDKYRTHGGDNIDLVRELSGLDRFIDCAYELNGGLRATPAPAPVPAVPKPPKIPPKSELGRAAGRMYLNDRGISDSTINHAEKTGFLRYLADGLLFVGYQAGQIWNATKRSIMPDAEIPKRDLAGSDKSKPQVLTGNPNTLWIVEGGVDALALHDIAKRKGAEPPTVIVSGGAGVLSFFDNPEIKEKIKAAAVVVVAKDNEKDAGTQAKTDAMHSKQVERAKQLNPDAQVIDWKPQAPEIKDIAELNEYQQRPRPVVQPVVTKDLDVNW